jgi:tRNA A-37 threonylcarbamoyl transferase component Bud32
MEACPVIDNRPNCLKEG